MTDRETIFSYRMRQAEETVAEAEIERMSRVEKLQTMEAIWADLSKADVEVQSPTWHEEILKETEARVVVGEEQITDWETAKRELWKQFE